MRGKYHIEISNRKLHFELDIDRKVTVIKGNSGTGKTTLIKMIQGFQEQGNKSGIRLKNEKNISLVVFLATTKWEHELTELRDHIIFVDEAVDYLYSKAFQEAFAESDNYIVIISRSGRFTHLPYSVQSIYQLRSVKGQDGTLTKMYRIYYSELKRCNKFEPFNTESKQLLWE